MNEKQSHYHRQGLGIQVILLWVAVETECMIKENKGDKGKSIQISLSKCVLLGFFFVVVELYWHD